MPINSFLYPAKNVPGAYEVANSCRFNNGFNAGGDDAYMHRTPGSAGNRRTFTLSAWIKRGSLAYAPLMSAWSANTDAGYLSLSTRRYNNGTASIEEAMRITSDGNVGIGTTSPGAQFEVVSPRVNDYIFNSFKNTLSIKKL